MRAKQLNRVFLSFLAMAFLVSPFLAAEPKAAEQLKVMLVLDGSGSMWGQIKGKSKIVIAREAVKDADGKRKHFNGNYDASPIFTLTAGKYLVVLKMGDSKWQHDLAVKPGDSRQVEVTLE